ncbi:hypothetical protein EDC96DRAFT_546286 [Choanephora cucurbitarum]|nr:hypothetical protein EDC96DRAFT_546286 [Choanephora cucurbitarum]
MEQKWYSYCYSELGRKISFCLHTTREKVRVIPCLLADTANNHVQLQGPSIYLLVACCTSRLKRSLKETVLEQFFLNSHNIFIVTFRLVTIKPIMQFAILMLFVLSKLLTECLFCKTSTRLITRAKKKKLISIKTFKPIDEYLNKRNIPEQESRKELAGYNLGVSDNRANHTSLVSRCHSDKRRKIPLIEE